MALVWGGSIDEPEDFCTSCSAELCRLVKWSPLTWSKACAASLVCRSFEAPWLMRWRRFVLPDDDVFVAVLGSETTC